MQNEIKYVGVHRRNLMLPRWVACEAELQKAIHTLYQTIEDRVEFEEYTDEIHVYIRRNKGKRRDWIASYQAE